MKTILVVTPRPCSCKQLLKLKLCRLQACLKNASHLDTAGTAGQLRRMNQKRFGHFPQRTSQPVIHLCGGLESRRSSQTCSGLPGMSYAYLVHELNFCYHIHHHVFHNLGSPVAMERVFSGGWDTISLRCTSIKPQTIRILMLIKQKLQLARAEGNSHR